MSERVLCAQLTSGERWRIRLFVFLVGTQNNVTMTAIKRRLTGIAYEQSNCNFRSNLHSDVNGWRQKDSHYSGSPPLSVWKKIAKCCLFEVYFSSSSLLLPFQIFLFIQVIQASFSWQDYHKRLVKWVSLISLFHLPYPGAESVLCHPILPLWSVDRTQVCENQQAGRKRSKMDGPNVHSSQKAKQNCGCLSKLSNFITGSMEKGFYK